jgi:hypothetical protein
MGSKWKPFFIQLGMCRDKDRKAAMQRLMKKLGTPKIPGGKLKKSFQPP